MTKKISPFVSTAVMFIAMMVGIVGYSFIFPDLTGNELRNAVTCTMTFVCMYSILKVKEEILEVISK